MSHKPAYLLSEMEVDSMKRMAAAGANFNEISKRFGISRWHVSRILRGISHKPKTDRYSIFDDDGWEEDD